MAACTHSTEARRRVLDLEFWANKEIIDEQAIRVHLQKFRLTVDI